MRSYLILLAAVAVAVPAGASAQERRDRRYSAEQTEHSIRACRDAVRQQAVSRFGARGIEIRDAHLDPDGDAIIGALDIPYQNYEDHYRFSCAMDYDRDEVRSVRITPIAEGSGAGYAERRDRSVDRAMDNCRSAVAGRIAERGYGRVQFDAMNVADRGAGDLIVGSAHARRGDDFDSFNFSCSVELRDGDLRSVSVTRR